MAAPSTSRLAYIDWMRGLACLLMFQTHCYDSWLSPTARNSKFFMWSQLGGTLPAPLFLFLAGFSVALVVDKLGREDIVPGQAARRTVKRGAQILGLGLLFRVQEYLIAFPWAPWTDLLRVDILNTIGISMMLMGVLGGLVSSIRGQRSWNEKRVAVAAGAGLTALAIALTTPLVWTSWRPRWLPWPLESYVDGVHNLGTPQAWLFPIFPWVGFACAGLAAGLLLLTPWSRKREALPLIIAGVAGLLLIQSARWLDRGPQMYAVYDFWHTSPNFFLIRVGILLVILAGSYLWCRWGAGQWGFSPLIQFGQTSLLVYWIHIEFVYGRVSILRKHGMTIAGASAGLLTIFLFMLVISIARTRMKKLGPGISVKKAAQAS